jgi:hypothetical protein
VHVAVDVNVDGDGVGDGSVEAGVDAAEPFRAKAETRLDCDRLLQRVLLAR